MNQTNFTSFTSTERRFYLPFFVLALTISIFLASSNTAKAINPEQQTPAWLEPRPLSIVDLISGGMDPALMKDTPVSWIPGQGLVQFVSGEKTATGVNVDAKILPTAYDKAFCLGQWGDHDQWAISVPASKMRIQSNGVDITSEIAEVHLFVTGLVQPQKGSSGGRRYETKVLSAADLTFASDGRLLMPENMGCQIYFSNNAAARGNITISYEHDITHYVSIDIVDQVIDYEFSSYYHDSDQGFANLASLNQQISDLKESECSGCSGNRHDKMKLVPPSEANYVLMVFPPVPVDPYAPIDELRRLKRYEGAGTYRLRENKSDFRDISVDWLTSAGIPMNFHSKDSDFSSGEKYLDFFKVDGEYRFHALEVVALNNEFVECMHSGGCSKAVLEQVSGTRMYVDFYFLKVDRVIPGLTQIPLCSVGPAWSPADAGTKCNDFRIARDADADLGSDSADNALGNSLNQLGIDSKSASSPFAPNMNHFVYLPLITNPLLPEPDNPTADCPCGWFADDGRMLGYVEHPDS